MTISDLSIHGLMFWAFVVIKVAGSALETWSWLWILLPEVPILALLLGRAGLL